VTVPVGQVAVHDPVPGPVRVEMCQVQLA